MNPKRNSAKSEDSGKTYLKNKSYFLSVIPVHFELRVLETPGEDLLIAQVF